MGEGFLPAPRLPSRQSRSLYHPSSSRSPSTGCGRATPYCCSWDPQESSLTNNPPLGTAKRVPRAVPTPSLTLHGGELLGSQKGLELQSFGISQCHCPCRAHGLGQFPNLDSTTHTHDAMYTCHLQAAPPASNSPVLGAEAQTGFSPHPFPSPFPQHHPFPGLSGEPQPPSWRGPAQKEVTRGRPHTSQLCWNPEASSSTH